MAGNSSLAAGNGLAKRPGERQMGKSSGCSSAKTRLTGNTPAKRLARVLPSIELRRRVLVRHRAAVRIVSAHDGRRLAEQRMRSSAGIRLGGTPHSPAGKMPPAAARIFQVWQRLGSEIRTDDSGRGQTGPPLNGMDGMDCHPGRCHKSLGAVARNRAEITRKLAAAREPSVDSLQGMTRTMSVIPHMCRRTNLPDLIPGGEMFLFRQNRLEMQTSLRSTRTAYPSTGKQQSFGRTHSALPGAIGVDTKKGAAIHRPVAPGESA